ncbi:sugar phosphate isomerase/epimerase family protein [Streptomyces zhihengii]|uniref:sugar phosphate isomerase/epimerase family protein n=1 Tax=Streptomyces zhihengii TaxID=1818004 RepID=UPI0036C7AE90
MNARAFSTLGCPGATLDEVIRSAHTAGVGSVELRCAPGELIAPDSTPRQTRALAGALASAGLRPVCLASYVRLAGDGDQLGPLAAVLRRAAETGAPYVRVFCGGSGPDASQRDRAVRTLAGAVPEARRTGVGILLETHDSFLTGELVAATLEAVGSPDTGAVWDVVNPWRAGEPVARTAESLAPWVRHVQLKDVAAPDDLRPVLPGHGAVPLGEALDALARIGYRGALSLEWERAWYPDAAPLDEALAAFVQVLDSHLPPG